MQQFALHHQLRKRRQARQRRQNRREVRRQLDRQALVAAAMVLVRRGVLLARPPHQHRAGNQLVQPALRVIAEAAVPHIRDRVLAVDLRERLVGGAAGAAVVVDRERFALEERRGLHAPRIYSASSYAAAECPPSVFLMAAAPCSIIAPIGPAAASGSRSATHTTRDPAPWALTVNDAL